jgi:hypothetical protein
MQTLALQVLWRKSNIDEVSVAASKQARRRGGWIWKLAN